MLIRTAKCQNLGFKIGLEHRISSQRCCSSVIFITQNPVDLSDSNPEVFNNFATLLLVFYFNQSRRCFSLNSCSFMASNLAILFNKYLTKSFENNEDFYQSNSQALYQQSAFSKKLERDVKTTEEANCV